MIARRLAQFLVKKMLNPIRYTNLFIHTLVRFAHEAYTLDVRNNRYTDVRPFVWKRHFSRPNLILNCVFVYGFLDLWS